MIKIFIPKELPKYDNITKGHHKFSKDLDLKPKVL